MTITPVHVQCPLPSTRAQREEDALARLRRLCAGRADWCVGWDPRSEAPAYCELRRGSLTWRWCGRSIEGVVGLALEARAEWAPELPIFRRSTGETLALRPTRHPSLREMELLLPPW